MAAAARCFNVALGVAVLSVVGTGLAARGSSASLVQLVTGALLLTVITIEFLAGRLTLRNTVFGRARPARAGSREVHRRRRTDRFFGDGRTGMAGRLDGKIAIVTGTSTGIGSATARLFVAEGAKVLAVDIKEPGERSSPRRSRTTATRSASPRSTCASEEAWAAGLAACVKAFGAAQRAHQQCRHRLGSGKPVHEETVEAMRANFDTNVIGMFLGMKTVIPGMIELGGGSIVNVSSVWGWSGIRNNAAYQTAKGAAVMLSKNAGVTYAPKNIRINCLLPGYVDTPMSRDGDARGGRRC